MNGAANPRTGGSAAMFMESAVRNKFPTIVHAFESSFSIDDIGQAIVANGLDEERAMQQLCRELLGRHSSSEAITTASAIAGIETGVATSPFYADDIDDMAIDPPSFMGRSSHTQLLRINSVPIKKEADPIWHSGKCEVIVIDDDDEDGNDEYLDVAGASFEQFDKPHPQTPILRSFSPADFNEAVNLTSSSPLVSDLPRFSSLSFPYINRSKMLSPKHEGIIVIDSDEEEEADRRGSGARKEEEGSDEFDPRGKRPCRSVSPATPCKKAKGTTAMESVRQVPLNDVFLDIPVHYMDETATTLVFGEQDSIDDLFDNQSQETLPVRILDDFVVYDINCQDTRGGYKITDLEQCGEPGLELRASGKVIAQIVEDQEDGVNDTEDENSDDEDDKNSDCLGLEKMDEDDGSNDGSESSLDQFINLSTIFHWELEMVENGESRIWIRTEFAFYRLSVPSADYVPFFVDLFKKTRLVNRLVVAVKENHSLIYKEFASRFPDVEDWSELSSGNALGSEMKRILLTEQDVQEHVGFMKGELAIWLEELAESTGERLSPPILKSLIRLESDSSGDQSLISDPDYLPQIVKRVREGRGITKRHLGQKKKPKVSKETEPCVTPLIAALAGDLFNRRLTISDPGQACVAETINQRSTTTTKMWTTETKETAWMGHRVGQTGNRSYYKVARVDGELINTGDCVFVRNEESDPWIARIMYMFEENGEMMCHVRYFQRGADTILMEMAGDKEIFLLDNCSDTYLEVIAGKCKVGRVIDAEQISSTSDHFFYRYWYDENLCFFEDASKHEILSTREFALCEELQKCESCARKLEAASEVNSVQTVEHGSDIITTFRSNGREYHEYDFVYVVNCELVGDIMSPIIAPTSKAMNPYNIGQIVKIIPGIGSPDAKATVKIRLLKRHDDFLPQNPVIRGRWNRIQRPVFRDCKRLVLTEHVQIFAADALEGTCRVMFTADTTFAKSLKGHKSQPNIYYCKDYLAVLSEEDEEGHFAKADLVRITDWTDVKGVKQCNICEEQWREKEAKQARIPKLRAMDIFSGCGGMSSGLRDTDVVETKYAVEITTSAALTYKHNFPTATVYNDDANTLLHRAISTYKGDPVGPKADLSGTPLPDMPLPGDVDMIYCGPPCQGFSYLNTFQHGDELKNTLIATSLSYVDFYRPRYFLLENVRGIVYYRLGQIRNPDGTHTGGVEMGVVKFILRSLTAMGYQCRFGLFQAGQHGLPQTRRRFFVWAAKIGSTLPAFPQPMTCFSKLRNLHIRTPLPNHEPFTYQGRRYKQAPDPALTVRDAIADLPGFEFINPHQVYEESVVEMQERLKEEQWAFRDAIRLRRRKRKQLERMVEKYGTDDVAMDDDEGMDVDGYVSSEDESEEERECQEEERGALKAAAGNMVPHRPYFKQLDGHGPWSGIGFPTRGKDGGDGDGDRERGVYLTRPQSEYQRQMRAGASRDIFNHIARPFNSINLERICRIAMRPGANHRTLPPKLRLQGRAVSVSKRNSEYGRIDFDEHYQTCITQIQPSGRLGSVIHPNQNRVLTVRECARLQGFPDRFEFLGKSETGTQGMTTMRMSMNEVKAMYRQVGNAVPPPLAFALGLKLKEALMEDGYN